MDSIHPLLSRLVAEKVEFVLVGGLAAVVHGSVVVTEDIDVLVRFDLETCSGVVRALSGLAPRLRMSVDKGPLGDDPSAYVGSRTLCVATSEGVIDFMSELTGVSVDEVFQRSQLARVGEIAIRVMHVEDLIKSKRAVARPKDLRVAGELERILQLKPK